jgi:hypothetical protein
MPDTQKPRLKPQIIGKTWMLRSEITTNLLHNDSSPDSMRGEADDEEAKVQITKSQTEAALGGNV